MGTVSVKGMMHGNDDVLISVFAYDIFKDKLKTCLVSGLAIGIQLGFLGQVRQPPIGIYHNYDNIVVQFHYFRTRTAIVREEVIFPIVLIVNSVLFVQIGLDQLFLIFQSALSPSAPIVVAGHKNGPSLKIVQ